jgi:hypothetical protein
MFRPFPWVIFRRTRILVLVFYCFIARWPKKGPKLVALPPTANKTNVDRVVSILSFPELLLCRLSHYIFFVEYYTDL